MPNLCDFHVHVKHVAEPVPGVATRIERAPAGTPCDRCNVQEPRPGVRADKDLDRNRRVFRVTQEEANA